MRGRTTLAALGLAALALAAPAAAVEPTATIDTIKLGEHWFGPELSSEELKGRVVLFEIWGLN